MLNARLSDGNLEMVQWLHENRTEGCSDRAMGFAAAHDSFEILLLFLRNPLSIKCTEKTAVNALRSKRPEMLP